MNTHTHHFIVYFYLVTGFTHGKASTHHWIKVCLTWHFRDAQEGFWIFTLIWHQTVWWSWRLLDEAREVLRRSRLGHHQLEVHQHEEAMFCICTWSIFQIVVMIGPKVKLPAWWAQWPSWHTNTQRIYMFMSSIIRKLIISSFYVRILIIAAINADVFCWNVVSHPNDIFSSRVNLKCTLEVFKGTRLQKVSIKQLLWLRLWGRNLRKIGSVILWILLKQGHVVLQMLNINLDGITKNRSSIQWCVCVCGCLLTCWR